MVIPLLWFGMATGLFVLTIWRPRSILYIFPIAVIFSPEFVFAQFGTEEVFVTFADIISLGLVFVVIRQRKIRLRSVWFVGIAFVVLTIISSVVGIVSNTVSSVPSVVFYIVRFIQYLFVGLSISTIVKDRYDFRRVVSGLGIVMLLSLISFPAIMLVQPSTYTFPTMGTQETAVIGAMGAVFFLPLLVNSNYEVPVKSRVVFGVSVLTGLLFILASAGRAGALGCVFGFLYVAYRQPELSLSRAVPAACVLGLFVLLIVFLIETPATQRLERSIRFVVTLNLEHDASLMARVAKWRDAIQLWTNHPIIGVGMPNAYWQWIDGWYVRVLHETGIFGLVTWLLFMADAYRHIVIGNQDRAYATGVAGVLIVMCTASVFGARFLTINTAMLFWFIIGAGLSAVPEQEQRLDQNQSITSRIH